MSLIGKDKGGGSFKPVSAGTHAAICTALVDIGPQDTPWGAKEKLKIRFEIPDERVTWADDEGVEQEGAAIIWATYTNSLFRNSNLRQDLEGWRGREFTKEELEGFDYRNILDKPCLLNVIHRTAENGNVYANIKSISKLPRGMALPQREGDLLVFDFDEHTEEDLLELPEWLQKQVDQGKALRSETMSRTEEEPPPPEDDGFVDDDIPF